MGNSREDRSAEAQAESIEPNGIHTSAKPRGSQRRRHRRVRLFYFALASIWGVLAGALAVLAGAAASGRPVSAHPALGVCVAVAVVLAVIGAAVAAAAYRQASRR